MCALRAAIGSDCAATAVTPMAMAETASTVRFIEFLPSWAGWRPAFRTTPVLGLLFLKTSTLREEARDHELVNGSGAPPKHAPVCRSLFRRMRCRRRLAPTTRGHNRDPAAHHIEHGREDEAEGGDADHARKHRSSERLAQLGAGSHTPHHRGNAKDEGERGHEDRPQP